MKSILFLIFIIFSLSAEELKIKADTFSADEKKGISIFSGNVAITKSSDNLSASKVVVHVDKKNQPTKFVAKGNVVFSIKTQEGALYKGKAGKVKYFPEKKEYHFYKNVTLEQVNEKKKIMGDEVVLKTIEGKAYAKGAKSEPVIMIFEIPEKEE